eukprot:4637882-Pleurochrysis_carterae.AAC.3
MARSPTEPHINQGLHIRGNRHHANIAADRMHPIGSRGVSFISLHQLAHISHLDPTYNSCIIIPNAMGDIAISQQLPISLSRPIICNFDLETD